MKGLELTEQIEQGSHVLDEIEALSKQDVEECYQCGKCTAGCPVAFAMDNPPRKLIRLLQLGYVDEALKSNSVWLCATCETCMVRCPRGVDIPRIMEAVSIVAKKKGIVPEKSIDLFNGIFLDSVKANGKVHEMALVIKHNLMSLQPFKDVFLSPKMFLNGKISILPHRIKNRAEVKRIFEKVQEKERGSDKQ